MNKPEQTPNQYTFAAEVVADVHRLRDELERYKKAVEDAKLTLQIIHDNGKKWEAQTAKEGLVKLNSILNP